MLMVFKCIYMCIISKSLIPSILYYTCIQLKTLKSNCDFAVLILLNLFNWKYSDLARILKDFCCNRLRCKKIDNAVVKNLVLLKVNCLKLTDLLH